MNEPVVLTIEHLAGKDAYYIYKRGRELGAILINRSDTVAQVVKNDTVTEVELKDTTLKTIIATIDDSQILSDIHAINAIAIKIAAPCDYFLQDRVITNHEIEILKEAKHIAPAALSNVIHEITNIKTIFPDKKIIGISDSAFHAVKPDYTWNYGIQLDDADKYDIKRYGFQGIMLQDVVDQIKQSKHNQAAKVVVCTLSNQFNVSAIFNGKSIDSTSGYTPTEGIIMPHASGTVDFHAGVSLARRKGVSLEDLATELQYSSGLSGIFGDQTDITTLLQKEADGNHRAKLAISMLVYQMRQAIARMTASLEGIDMLVFAQDDSSDYSALRSRVVAGLEYLSITIAPTLNSQAHNKTTTLVQLQPRTRSKPVLYISTKTARVMSARARKCCR